MTPGLAECAVAVRRMLHLFAWWPVLSQHSTPRLTFRPLSHRVSDAKVVAAADTEADSDDLLRRIHGFRLLPVRYNLLPRVQIRLSHFAFLSASSFPRKFQQQLEQDCELRYYPHTASTDRTGTSSALSPRLRLAPAFPGWPSHCRQLRSDARSR